MKKIIFICLLLTSCISQKKWLEIGQKKGWYKIQPEIVNDSLKVDSVVNSDTNRFKKFIDTTNNDLVKKLYYLIDSLRFEALNYDNVYLTEEAKLKTKIKNDSLIKLKLQKLVNQSYNNNKIQKVVEQTGCFDSLTFIQGGDKYVVANNGNKSYYLKRYYKKNNVTIITAKWYEQYWWIWFIIAVFSWITTLIILQLKTKD